MGYTTEFEGRFNLDKKLRPEHAAYLRKFADTRRMRRTDASAMLPDQVRVAVDLPIGRDGEFFVGAGGDFGQDRDATIVDYNDPPPSQPGLWCKWVPTKDDAGIEWSGAEKFYEYVKWLDYLIAHFIKPWGYTLNGIVTWEGEDRGDVGAITVKDNVVYT